MRKGKLSSGMCTGSDDIVKRKVAGGKPVDPREQIKAPPLDIQSNPNRVQNALDNCCTKT